MPNDLHTLLTEYRWLLAVVAVVLVAGLFVLTDELVRGLKRHTESDARKAARALQQVNAQIERETRAAIRGHEWH